MIVANLISDLIPSLLLVVCFIALLVTPWLPDGRRYGLAVAAIALIASIVSAIVLKKAEAWVVVPLAVLFGVSWLAHRASPLLQRLGMSAAAVVLALEIATHKVPGFYSQAWFENLAFSEQARPFTLLAHWDKPWVGAVLMLACSPLGRGVMTLRQGVMWAVGAAMLLFAIGMGVGIPVEPKWQSAIAVFWLHNLFFTCMAEEAFFRLLIQAPLSEACKRWRGGNIVVVIAVSALFGAVHFHADIPLTTLALITIGGAVYAIVFQVTRALHWAILAHFLTNALHILLLRYPLV